MIKSPRAVAAAVCEVLGGSTADGVMAPQRGSPRTAYLRAVSMYVWMNQHRPRPTYTETGTAFGRDRRNVIRGIIRMGKMGAPRHRQMIQILDRLNAPEG